MTWALPSVRTPPTVPPVSAGGDDDARCLGVDIGQSVVERKIRSKINVTEEYAEQLRLATEWAAMHSVDSLDEAAASAVFGETVIPIAGPGAPLVGEFCVAEFAADPLERGVDAREQDDRLSCGGACAREGGSSRISGRRAPGSHPGPRRRPSSPARSHRRGTWRRGPWRGRAPPSTA